MKKLLLLLTIALGLSAVSFAQKTAKMKMKDGVMMVGDKAMLCKAGKCSPLTTTYTCSDQCKISPDGTITKPDGTTMKLKSGYEIDKSGKMAMIPHGQSGHVCGPDCSMMKEKMKGKM
jgi:predicted S18 family serine protease